MNLKRRIQAIVNNSEARGIIDSEVIGKLVDKVEENLRRFITIKNPNAPTAIFAGVTAQEIFCEIIKIGILPFLF